MSYIKNLQCPQCSQVYVHDLPINLCECGSPLLVNYDLDKTREEFKKESLQNRRLNNMWRFRELLPIRDERNIVSLGEGDTPLFRLNNVGKQLDLKNIYLKDESFNPTGTFKARGASAGISKIKELGIKEICMPTAGNAGGAWSAYSAKANIRIHVVMPIDAPDLARKECVMFGADTFLVDGLISDAGKIITESAKKHGWFEVSTFKEPYRVEGKKTMGFEILEQFDWEMPDAILFPTGGGEGLVGIWKAIKEMELINWVSGKNRPKMVAVQAEGCAPIVEAFEEGKRKAKFWSDAETIATGIRVPKGIGDFLVLDAIYESGGSAVMVTDKEIIAAMEEMAKTEGMLVCPEGAANIAALPKLIRSGVLVANDTIVVINTGSGLKYGNLLKGDVPTIAKYTII